jgi:hypothetical protein
MISTAAGIESLTLNVTKEIHVRASLKQRSPRCSNRSDRGMRRRTVPRCR